MLSKVAERLYWTARYLERVENTARLITVYDQLLYDLPREINLSWYNLIELNGFDDLFQERYKVQNEHNVTKFLLADDTNPSSVLSTLWMIRENVRTSRDSLPEESWEMINEFYHKTKDSVADGFKRTLRHSFLTEVIENCQKIQGMLSSTMRRDAGWQFIKMGKNLERADMTTRILDAGSSVMISTNGDAHVNMQQIVWGNVLRSDSAYSAFRRTVKNAISGPEVAHFLLHDSYFPRSLKACLGQIEEAASKLPKSNSLNLEDDHKYVDSIKPTRESDLELNFRQQLNTSQIRLIEINTRIANTWFTAAIS